MKAIKCAIALICVLILLALCPIGGLAEDVILTGDLTISEAPCELRVLAVLRVDVIPADSTGVWAEVTLPELPPGNVDVLLYDGWHVIPAYWAYGGGNTLRLLFLPADLARLDGTVGIYLVILAER